MAVRVAEGAGPASAERLAEELRHILDHLNKLYELSELARRCAVRVSTGTA